MMINIKQRKIKLEPRLNLNYNTYFESMTPFFVSERLDQFAERAVKAAMALISKLIKRFRTEFLSQFEVICEDYVQVLAIISERVN